MTMMIGLLIGFFCSFVSFRGYLWIARHYSILSEPNDRSAHVKPTPSGLGITFFFPVIATYIFYSSQLNLEYTYFLPILVAGPVVLLMGYIDDVKPMSAIFRLVAHLLAGLFIYLLLSSGFRQVFWVSFLPSSFYFQPLLGVLFVMWFINLYNFMDGCDGLAGGVGALVSLLIAGVAYYLGDYELSYLYLGLFSVLVAFLQLNWSPAKVFMGDSGAYFLGFLFGTTALISKIKAEFFLFAHLLLFGTLIVDATWTLIRRSLRGEKVYRPHRLHGFQKLMDVYGWPHWRVSACYMLLTLLWLFPLLLLSLFFHAYSLYFLAAAYIPLLFLMIFLEAGVRNESA